MWHLLSASLLIHIHVRLTLKSPLDARWLHIPLYDAERAWAYAMELKHATDGPTSRMRFHLLKRLQKAAKLADKFAELCAHRADDQTSLEAEVRRRALAFSDWS